MHYTEHYHLPQWAAEDRILREDFNQMCADIDRNARDVTLLRYTLDTPSQEVELDLSPWDLTRFSDVKLLCFGSVQGVGGKHYLYFNDLREGENFRNSSGNYDPGCPLLNISSPGVDRTDLWFRVSLGGMPHGILIQVDYRMLHVRDGAPLAYRGVDGSGTNKLLLEDVSKLTASFPSTMQPGFSFLATGTLR